MVARGSYHFGVDGWPLFEQSRLIAYAKLWDKLASKATEKLQSGEWIAEGISPSFGPVSVRINTNLWDYLRIVDRAEEAEGSGFRFILLTITEAIPSKGPISHAAQPSLRRQLANWIRGQAESGHGPVRKADLLKEASLAFGGLTITKNLFANAWREADLPTQFVFRGRPKA